MGDRHGDCFARRGRALSPPRPRVDAHPAVVFRRRAVVGRICPARERSPRRKSLDTAHKRKDLPRARTFPTAKASRHGARAKGFAPRRNTPLGEGRPTRRTSERICPARERSPRRKPPDTAHGRKDLPRAGTLPRRRPPDTAHERKDLPRARTFPTAKASRHGARAKGFAPRRNALLGEGLQTRRTGERICPAQEHAPRRRPPDTAHERKGLPRPGTLPSAKASRHGARAKRFTRARRLSSTKASRHGARAKGFAPAQEHAPRRKPPDTAQRRKDLPRAGFPLAPRADERRAALDRRTAEKHPFGGVAPERARPLPSSFTEKK